MSKITTRWGAELEVRAMESLRGKLAAMLGDEDDDHAAIRDTIEGAADLNGCMEELIGLRQEYCALAESRRELASRYTHAARKAEEQAEKIEGLIMRALEAAGQPGWKGAAGTASIRKGSISCVIDDPARVPLAFQKMQPDKALVKAALMMAADAAEVGEFTQFRDADVPGATLVRGDKSLSVRLPGKKESADA